MKMLLKALNRLEEGVLGFGLLTLAIMAFGEVVSRYVFNHSFTWMEELSRYAGVMLTFMGASLGVKYGVHFSMDFVVTRAPTRVSRIMYIATNLITAVLFLVIAWYGWQHAAKMMRFGTTSAAMRIPMWIPYLPIPVFSLVMVVRFIIQIVKHVKGFLNDEPLGQAAGSGPAKKREAAS